jgi:hypothetical protein
MFHPQSTRIYVFFSFDLTPTPCTVDGVGRFWNQDFFVGKSKIR